MRMGEVAAWVEQFVAPGSDIDVAALEPALEDLRKMSAATRAKLDENAGGISTPLPCRFVFVLLAPLLCEIHFSQIKRGGAPWSTAMTF